MDSQMRSFRRGDRVRVGPEAGWPTGPIGTILRGPITSGKWRDGQPYIFYTILFDKPEPDTSDDGPYFMGTIPPKWLEPAQEQPSENSLMSLDERIARLKKERQEVTERARKATTEANATGAEEPLEVYTGSIDIFGP